MSKHFLYILLSVSILSCQNVDKNIAPDKILTKNQMALVLMDIAQFKIIKTNYSKEFENIGINSNDYLCAKHDIDSTTLQENLRYYSYEPNVLKEIYEKVYDSLEKSKTQITDFIEKQSEIQESETEKIDSISIKISQKKSSPSVLKNKTRN